MSSTIEQKLNELNNNIKKLEGDNLKDTIDSYSNTNRNIYILFMLLLLTIFSIATRIDDDSLLLKVS